METQRLRQHHTDRKGFEMTKQFSATSALWQKLESAEAFERGVVLAEIFNALVAEESDDLFSVGYSAIDELEATEDFEEAFEVAQRLSERLTTNGRHEECEALIEALIPSEQWVKPNTAAMLRWNYAFNFHQAEKYELAEIEYACAHDSFEESHKLARAYVMQGRGNCLVEMTRKDEASKLFASAIALFEETSSPAAVASCKEDLGELLLANGDYKMAVRYLEDAQFIYEFLDWHDSIQRCQVLAARAHISLKEFVEAERLLQLSSIRRVNDDSREQAAESLYYLAEIAELEGRAEAARAAFRAVSPVLASVGLHLLADQAAGRSVE